MKGRVLKDRSQQRGQKPKTKGTVINITFQLDTLLFCKMQQYVA